MSKKRHLAQVNIGRARGGPDDPRMKDFFDNLSRINLMAERMPGFVWRLKDAAGDGAMDLHWPGDPTMNVNMSVWESDDALATFVFKTVHQNFYARADEFFKLTDTPHVAMWWIDAGHIPTIDEAKERLDRLIAHGSSEFAFGWLDLPSAATWRERRCA
ncbi:MAG: DUF3291 domain-containing protein [Pseudomonadota bacterium]